jgi:carbonic anhydrase
MLGGSQAGGAGVERLIDGVLRFQQDVYPEWRELFEQLAGGQQPRMIFITCADSRIDPCLLTQTAPGDLFVIRNAGNVIPPYEAAIGDGSAASLELAVAELGAEHIVVCGHSGCGAIHALLHPESVSGLPAVVEWLAHAEPARRAVAEAGPVLRGEALADATIKQNVLVQLGNLLTYPSVSAGVANGTLQLHGWVYNIGTGEVAAYSESAGEFVPLASAG